MIQAFLISHLTMAMVSYYVFVCSFRCSQGTLHTAITVNNHKNSIICETHLLKMYPFSSLPMKKGQNPSSRVWHRKTSTVCLSTMSTVTLFLCCRESKKIIICGKLLHLSICVLLSAWNFLKISLVFFFLPYSFPWYIFI